MKLNNQNSLLKRRKPKQAIKTTTAKLWLGSKLYLNKTLKEKRSLQWTTVNKYFGYSEGQNDELRVATNWHWTKGDEDYLTHEEPRGTGGNTQGIREDNQTLDTGGRASYLKREEELIFQNKTGNDKTTQFKT